MSLLFSRMTTGLLALASLASVATLASACRSGCPSDARCLDGQCVSLGNEGDPCTRWSCAAGLWCPSLRCARATTLGPACDPKDDAENLCGDGWCDPLTSRCLPLPEAGDDCTLDDRCAIDAFCSGGFCVALPGEHEPCLSSSGLQCALDLVCDGYLCGRPTDGACPAVPSSNPF